MLDAFALEVDASHKRAQALRATTPANALRTAARGHEGRAPPGPVRREAPSGPDRLPAG